MAGGKVAVIAGGYQSKEDAKDDLESVRMLHSVENLGTYDAAIVEKKPGGKVDVAGGTEVPTQHSAGSGLAAGAVVGLIFPPSMIVTGAIGAGIGGLVGHLKSGMKSKDVKQVGDALNEGQAALIVVVDAIKAQRVIQVMAKAFRFVNVEIDMDIKDLDNALSTALAQWREAKGQESG
jgi:uncharacterized membrane protein